MSVLTICAGCEHICRTSLPIEPAQCLADVSVTEKIDFVTGRTVIVYDKEPCLCAARNRSGHCALFAQQDPGRIMIIEDPKRRHWWQIGIAARPALIWPDRKMVTHIHPDSLPPLLRDDDCGDYHRWPR